MSEAIVKPAAERIEKGLWWDRPLKLVEGCSPVSEGCLNCWSAKEAYMRAQQKNEKIRAQYEGLTTPEGRWNGQIRLMEKNLDLPMRVKRPQVWAVWNDLFHEDVPFDFICDVFARMEFEKRHTFLILTKRPERAKEFFDTWSNVRWPLPNVWLGVTAENQQQAVKRIPVLLQIPAVVRFVSVEPMLSKVDLQNLKYDGDILDALAGEYLSTDGSEAYVPWNKLDWVICGSESGPRKRPAQTEWIRDLKDQCVAAAVPFYLKQMEVDGKLVKLPELDGKIWAQFPEVQYAS